MFVSVSCAPGTTALDESLTLPRTVAVWVWAHSMAPSNPAVKSVLQSNIFFLLRSRRGALLAHHPPDHSLELLPRPPCLRTSLTRPQRVLLQFVTRNVVELAVVIEFPPLVARESLQVKLFFVVAGPRIIPRVNPVARLSLFPLQLWQETD